MTKPKQRHPTMDILSCLPDEVIIHILSFLPTQRSVQTSVLSKRWCFLWAYVPFLEFLVDDYADDTLNSKIITKIVLEHKHDLDTFKLDLDNGVLDASEEEFESCIVNITTRNIRNLVMDLNDQFVLPWCIFTCRTLVYLSLAYSEYIPMSGIYLPLLKKLELEGVQFESHESLAHMISGCPMLEELSINGKVLGHCCVSSPTLTRLQLKLYIDEFSNFEVKLDTPALRYLELNCPMPDLLSVGTLDSLVEADIRFYWDEPHQDNFIYPCNLLAFVAKLYNVKLLKFSTHHITVVNESAFFASAVKFHNLTKLELCSYFGIITSFLENANNLQALKIRLAVGHVDNQSCWMEPKRVPTCLISHLQSVNLYFSGSKDEFDMVSYILMNAKVLKVMEIRNESLRKCYWKKKFGVLERRRRLFERTLENAALCSIEIV